MNSNSNDPSSIKADRGSYGYVNSGVLVAAGAIWLAFTCSQKVPAGKFELNAGTPLMYAVVFGSAGVLLGSVVFFLLCRKAKHQLPLLLLLFPFAYFAYIGSRILTG